MRGVCARSSKWTAGDALGASLRLSYAVRTRLGIRTIGSHDANKAAREKLNKARKRERGAPAGGGEAQGEGGEAEGGL